MGEYAQNTFVGRSQRINKNTLKNTFLDFLRIAR